MKFKGYRRPDGRVGSRNIVALIPTVVCSNDVASSILAQVQGTQAILHHQGCCQLPPDLERVTDTLLSLSLTPNIGAVLLLSLGCEGTDVERLYEGIKKSGKPVEIVKIQEIGGTANAIADGINKAQALVRKIGSQQREDIDISEVIMSIKCGGSDATSGMASNAVIGYVADKLVSLGQPGFGETAGL